MRVLKKFILFIQKYFQDVTHKKFLSLGVILILAAAIPLTTLVLQNRDATKTQQHAATINNYCNSSTPANSFGVCGTTSKWGICGATQSLTGYNVKFPSINPEYTIDCQGFDDNSACQFPIVTPVPLSNSKNNLGQCGPNGYGMCLTRTQHNTLGGFRTFTPVRNTTFVNATSTACETYGHDLLLDPKINQTVKNTILAAENTSIGQIANFGCSYPDMIYSEPNYAKAYIDHDASQDTIKQPGNQHPVCQTTVVKNPPAQTSSNPCAHVHCGPGAYCGNDAACGMDTTADPNTLYQCDGNGNTLGSGGQDCSVNGGTCISGGTSAVDRCSSSTSSPAGSGGTGIGGGTTTSSSGGGTLGFFDIGPYECTTTGIRGWACVVGQSTPVNVDFYLDHPYTPGGSNTFLGEIPAGISEGDDAAIDASQYCATTGPHRFHFPLNNLAASFLGTHPVYGYINIGDGQLHPLGQAGQQYTCTSASAAPAANACTNNLVWSTPATGDTKLVPSSCDATGSFSSLNVSWPAQKNSSGVAATQYVLDWWFTDSNGVYNECNKVVSGTATTISDADNTSANKAQTSTVHTVHCFVPGAKIGASFKVNAPSEGCYQQHGSSVQACPTTGGSPVSTTTHTLLNITLQLPGIGQGGNLSPKHQIRPLHVTLYTADQDPTQPGIKPIFDSKDNTLKYNSINGLFTNQSVDVGNLPTGDYKLLVKVPGYLRKELSNSTTDTSTIHITGQTTTLVPLIKLTPGDVAALFNVIDISDFYAIVACYKDKADSSSCTTGSQITDINDDGMVDGIDINYWLLGFESLQTNGSAQGTGDGIPGD